VTPAHRLHGEGITCSLSTKANLRKDLENAGASWEDSEVVEDGGLITSRKPDDIPAFTQAVIRAVAG